MLSLCYEQVPLAPSALVAQPDPWWQPPSPTPHHTQPPSAPPHAPHPPHPPHHPRPAPHPHAGPPASTPDPAAPHPRAPLAPLAAASGQHGAAAGGAAVATPAPHGALAPPSPCALGVPELRAALLRDELLRSALCPAPAASPHAGPGDGDAPPLPACCACIPTQKLLTLHAALHELAEGAAHDQDLLGLWLPSASAMRAHDASSAAPRPHPHPHPHPHHRHGVRVHPHQLRHFHALLHPHRAPQRDVQGGAAATAGGAAVRHDSRGHWRAWRAQLPSEPRRHAAAALAPSSSSAAPRGGADAASLPTAPGSPTAARAEAEGAMEEQLQQQAHEQEEEGEEEVCPAPLPPWDWRAVRAAVLQRGPTPPTSPLPTGATQRCRPQARHAAPLGSPSPSAEEGAGRAAEARRAVQAQRAGEGGAPGAAPVAVLPGMWEAAGPTFPLCHSLASSAPEVR